MGEVVESVGAVPIASLPFVPPLQRLVQLCLFYSEATPSRQTAYWRQHGTSDSPCAKHVH